MVELTRVLGRLDKRGKASWICSVLYLETCPTPEQMLELLHNKMFKMKRYEG